MLDDTPASLAKEGRRYFSSTLNIMSNKHSSLDGQFAESSTIWNQLHSGADALLERLDM